MNPSWKWVSKRRKNGDFQPDLLSHGESKRVNSLGKKVIKIKLYYLCNEFSFSSTLPMSIRNLKKSSMESSSTCVGKKIEYFIKCDCPPLGINFSVDETLYFLLYTCKWLFYLDQCRKCFSEKTSQKLTSRWQIDVWMLGNVGN